MLPICPNATHFFFMKIRDIWPKLCYIHTVKYIKALPSSLFISFVFVITWVSFSICVHQLHLITLPSVLLYIWLLILIDFKWLYDQMSHFSSSQIKYILTILCLIFKAISLFLQNASMVLFRLYTFMFWSSFVPATYFFLSDMQDAYEDMRMLREMHMRCYIYFSFS